MNSKQRSLSQNNAIHKYLDLVAHELQNQGQTMRDVIQKLPEVEILPTTKTLKEIVWKPIQKASLGKESTTELETAEVTLIYYIMSMFLSKHFQIDIPFPSNDTLSLAEYYNEETKNREIDA